MRKGEIELDFIRYEVCGCDGDSEIYLQICVFLSAPVRPDWLMRGLACLGNVQKIKGAQVLKIPQTDFKKNVKSLVLY